jgi:hypothetical protein
MPFKNETFVFLEFPLSAVIECLPQSPAERNKKTSSF